MNNKWIPVSERLPEEMGAYLVSFDDDFVRFSNGWYKVSVVWFFADKKTWLTDFKIKAWMPLPEPYKGA